MDTTSTETNWDDYADSPEVQAAVTTPVAQTPTGGPQAHPAQATPTDEVSDERALAAETAFYARRRRQYAVATVLAIAGLAYFLGPRFSGTSHLAGGASATPTVHTGTDAAAPVAPVAITKAMKVVTKALARTGDLSGLTLAHSRVAAAGNTLYASEEIDGVCWGYAVINGVPAQAQIDPAGTACTDAAITDTQQRLDAATAYTGSTTRRTAITALTQAAALVGYYGTHNIVAGVPNLDGLTLPGKTVLASNNTGTHVRLTAMSGTSCETLVAAADGTPGMPRACH